MVFGDPHYKTFDGKIYSFQGIGKYQLVSDCHAHTFSIRVANMYQNRHKHSTLTKRVQIKTAGIRINLGQKLRTKVNGEKITVPFKKDGKIRIEKDHEYLVVTLPYGVKLLWNGKSFLEVTVPTSFKNRLCGLCGNFNGNVQDDFKMRKGPVVNETKVLKFATSWCVGKDCAKQAKRTALVRPCKPTRIGSGIGKCKYLKSEELFGGCDSKLNYSKYYKACVHDMCDCPSGKCYCESLTAYAQECKRLGVKLQNWQKNSYCLSNYKQAKHSAYPSYSNIDIEKILKQRGLNLTRSRSPIPIH